MKRLIQMILVGAGFTANIHTASAVFVVDDQVVSDPATFLGDPEFDSRTNQMVWQDALGDLWVADIDPATGDISPLDGKGTLVDSGLASIVGVGNGPEWTYGVQDAHIAYTRLINGTTRAIGIASMDGAGGWTTRILNDGFNRWRPEGTSPSNTSAARIAYIKGSGAGNQIAWRNIVDSTSETVATSGVDGARFVAGSSFLVSTAKVATVSQLQIIHEVTGQVTQITFGANHKYNPATFIAPEFNEPMITTMQNKTAVAVWRNVAGVWEKHHTINLPTSKGYVSSPEPFTYGGKSYVAVVAADALGVGNFPFQPAGDTEIWIAGIDPGQPFYRRIDDPSTNAQRSEPEVYEADFGPVVFYTETDPVAGTAIVRRADTGLGDTTGYDMPLYGGPWSVMHRDNRNSGSTPYEIPDAYVGHNLAFLKNVQINRPTMGPKGNIYIPYYDTNAGYARKFASLEAATGAVNYSHDSTVLLPDVTVAAGNLIDRNGDYYVSTEGAMNKLDSDGNLIWSTPIEGFTRSPQFTSTDKLIFLTWNGWVYVMEPSDGTILMGRTMTGWRNYPATASCAISGINEECAYVRAPAYDPATDMLFATFSRTDGLGALQAYQYDPLTHAVDRKWRSTLHVAPWNGSATAPVLSPDYSRAYVQDGDGFLHALNTINGTTAWSMQLGYVSSEPPVVSESGYIMPGGSINEDPAISPIGLIEDLGTSGAWVFQDVRYVQESSAAAGKNDRFVVVGRDTATNGLVVLVMDPLNGITSVTDWGLGIVTSVEGVLITDNGGLYAHTRGNLAYKEFVPAATP